MNDNNAQTVCYYLNEHSYSITILPRISLSYDVTVFNKSRIVRYLDLIGSATRITASLSSKRFSISGSVLRADATMNSTFLSGSLVKSFLCTDCMSSSGRSQIRATIVFFYSAFFSLRIELHKIVFRTFSLAMK